MAIVATLLNGAAVYIVGFNVTFIVMLIFGYSHRDLPTEVFFMAMFWPVFLPLWLGENAYHRVSD